MWHSPPHVFNQLLNECCTEPVEKKQMVRGVDLSQDGQTGSFGERETMVSLLACLQGTVGASQSVIQSPASESEEHTLHQGLHIAK